MLFKFFYYTSDNKHTILKLINILILHKNKKKLIIGMLKVYLLNSFLDAVILHATFHHYNKCIQLYAIISLIIL